MSSNLLWRGSSGRSRRCCPSRHYSPGMLARWSRSDRSPTANRGDVGCRVGWKRAFELLIVARWARKLGLSAGVKVEAGVG